MAVELVATAFLTVAFEKLFKRLSSREFANFFRGKKSVDEQLKVLNGKLKTVSLLLDDAEDKQMVKPSVKEWLEDLKDVIFKVDDLVEEITEEARIKFSESDQSGSKIGVLMKSLFTSFTEFDRTVEADVTKFSEDLDILMNRAVVLDLKNGNPRSSVQRSLAPLKEERYVYGRDSDKEKILKLLLSSSDDKIGVLPIVGMGGLGKTTLAQLVYDDERVKEHQFDLKAWVTVSTEFDVFKIIKTLLQQIGGTSHTEEPTVLQRAMKEALRGKKFLFVLDDVWDEDYDNWYQLMSIFAGADSRSKIIMTTRSRKVCSIVKTGPIHKLKLVSSKICWKIFVHHAFDGDLNADKELQEIGKRIVEKCKGLPLAVKAVGGLLRSERNPKKWETISRSHVWEWSRSQGSGVLPSLWLSYQYLPSPLKQCFAYCAVFPQDYPFNKRDMVLIWMAEGFLQSDAKEKSLEEVGDEYFEVLISRSFFQRYKYFESRYAMHDLVHDLATFVSGQFCLSLSGNTKLGSTSSKTRYLYRDARFESNPVKGLGEATYLHTYIDESGSRSTTDSSVEEILEAGRFLRVLCVRDKSIFELLSSAGKHLKHLRYLNLSKSDIEEVPDSVCTLYSLQTLVLSNCERLSKLPTNMGNLINLRHLDTTSSNKIKRMPPRMGNLKELRTLTDFFVGKADDEGCSSIKELGEIPHLVGELRVRGLQNVETADDARKANFRDKGNLVKLVLEWEGESSDTRREREVLDALQPHTNLEELSILGYAASSFPNWVGDSSFSKMVSLTLTGSSSHNFCSSLPPLGQLVSLEDLEIRSFNWVESIGSEFYGSNSSIIPFPCLETLGFYDMSAWKEWSFVGRDGNQSFGCFPRLKYLSFYKCPNMSALKEWTFVGRDGKESGCFPRLKHLDLSSCPNLGVESLLDCETLNIWDSLDSMECFPLDKFPRLKSLSLNICPNLKSITSSAEDHRLTSLKIYNCPEMESFPEGGLPLSLESLGIGYCSKLVAQNRHWDLQRLTSLTSLCIIGSATNNLDSFPQGLLPTSLTSFELGRFQNLNTLNGSAFQQLKSLQRLGIFECNELESLPEQVLPTSLRYLRINKCPLLERRYRKEKGEDWHYISHIPRMCIEGPTTSELELEERERTQSETNV